MKYLEREDHWTYSEEVEVKTRVKIAVQRETLYGLDLPDPLDVQLLDIMMRKCEGVFSYPVQIDEEYFAGKIGVSVPHLRMLLYDLAVHHLIVYIPAVRSEMLFLHHSRLRPGNVALSPRRYALLAESYRKRTDAMRGYVTGTGECRQSYLLRYFGQEESAPCGKCDLCRSGAVAPKKPDNRQEELGREIKAFILSGNGDYTLDDIRRHFAPDAATAPEEIMEILRKMIDSGEVAPYRVE